VADASDHSTEEDPDVSAERARVLGVCDHLPSVHGDARSRPLLSATDRTDAVVVEGLRKVFPASGDAAEKVAVDSVFLGIPQGECFGLLGHNGAGKTSLIGMLTGVTTPTSGDAYIRGCSVVQRRDEALAGMGFCPQFGGLWPTLTLHEHLEFYLGMRGFQAAEVAGLAGEVEAALDVVAHGDKLVQELSGGNQRKLSAALALVGGPGMVYLDEPSTGVDAATRRHLWSLIEGSKAGRATILTTHSMEEADILSDRIGIMASGKLRALGTPQTLKSKHGAEYLIDVKLGAEVGEGAGGAAGRVRTFVEGRFEGSRLDEHFADSMRFVVPAVGIVAGPRLGSGVGSGAVAGLGSTFDLIESHAEALGIREFSISQTTLEMVFLRVARQSTEVPTSASEIFSPLADRAPSN
jgi:ABC-type multidrug transport system ATPase subunit